MCGIVGFVGTREAAPIVLNTMRRLEYRGYDSAGLATVNNGHIELKKDIGMLAAVQRKHHLDSLQGQTGIGHVRWATHGVNNSVNAHPHYDCSQHIAVVHNGIIENHLELRSRLESTHKFISDTDTEVISHLIEEHLKSSCSLEEAVLQVNKEIEGSYAFLAVSTSDPGKIVAARQDNPLAIGTGKDGSFVASDALCLTENINQVFYPEDGDIAILTKDGVCFQDSKGRPIEIEPQEIDAKWVKTSKYGHDYYMHKEIQEQPETLRQALMQDRDLIKDIASDILKAKQVIFTACGTSRYASIIGRYAFSKLAKKFGEVVLASEFGSFAESIDEDTLVIAVSQSGETADVLRSIKKAKNKGATIVSLTNVTGSSLARISDKVIYLHCGPELCVAATKSFVNQLAIFYMLAYAAAGKLEDGIADIQSVSIDIEGILAENGQGLSNLARRLREKNDFYYIARGINYAIAGEGALKLKEVAYVHAEGLPAGELKHGTLALIETGTPVVAICPRDKTYADTISNASEAKARGAYIIGVSDHEHPVFDEWIKIPTVPKILYPLVSVVPLQLFAYYSAIERGCNPDRPRNLAKSVTVS